MWDPTSPTPTTNISLPTPYDEETTPTTKTTTTPGSGTAALPTAAEAGTEFEAPSKKTENPEGSEAKPKYIDAGTLGPGGRVIEVLSEHLCQGWMQGYTLSGRVGLFPSYESFLPIITTMVIQYAKFIKIATEVPWRPPVAALNYIESSTLWRQEHNGFSHQNPGFIDSLITLKSSLVHIYLPPDANTFLCVINSCLKDVNKINLVVGAKHEVPVWLSME
ncbi:hypothetical protein HK102_009155, partial [Quaeritorhiza haematococci]